jgi:transcriptional regulator with XRE-family HTH domain
MSGVDPAELIRTTRERLGLSQRRLALRAGTTQAQVSRIERGDVSPTFATLESLMLAMGERLTLHGERLECDWDPVHMTSTLERSDDQRAALAFSWDRFAARLAHAGASARADG